MLNTVRCRLKCSCSGRTSAAEAAALTLWNVLGEAYARLGFDTVADERSEEHTSELQSHSDLVCRLLLEKKKKK